VLTVVEMGKTRSYQLVTSDYEIGRVMAVNTAQVTIELNPDLKALTRGTYEATVEVGRINSYVIIPVGPRKIVAMVTNISMTEEAELRVDRTMVTLPSARRLMKATMIGTIDGNEFTQGISLFPTLDNPVLVATKEDLKSIFDTAIDDNKSPAKGDPGYCIPIGKSVIFPDFDININPDTFFGKHAAVIGSTGAGKSCTIASIIQSVIEQPKVKNARFIVLDTNGEYRSAFQVKQQDKAWHDANSKYRCLYLPADQNQQDECLVIPYWFMNSDDFVRLFRANVGIQSPILKRSLGLARADSGQVDNGVTIGSALLAAINRIRAHCENDVPSQQWAIPNNIKKECENALEFETAFPNAWGNLEDLGLASIVKNAFSVIKVVVTPSTLRSNDPNYTAFGATTIYSIFEQLDKLREVVGETDFVKSDVSQSDPDAPSYFDLQKMVSVAIDAAMREQAEASSPGRVREACGPMMLRIQRYLTDPRFNFLFGDIPEPPDALATFIRDIMGLIPASSEQKVKDKIKEKGDNKSSTSSISEIKDDSNSELAKPVLPFCLRQGKDFYDPHNVVVIDLSLLASEVLENVTALIGRLILEFLQRLGDEASGVERGSFPVVLVLEEAQNYIRETRGYNEESISKEVFERIAREGRKYGLGLVVASQRPSELSKTVLSQCNSFIVHRLQNPEDLRYFKEIVPGIYDQLLDQLPALAPRNALVLGECVRAPALAFVREANPAPKSKDPKFYEKWVSDDPPMPNVEAICGKWEGKEIEEESALSEEVPSVNDLHPSE